MSEEPTHDDVGEIAIIGMACRFPQAATLEAFWDNLSSGRESITRLTGEDIAGLPAELIDNPSFVASSGRLDGVDLFDAAFFGLSPAEATATDPQQRLFLECGWEALESAGYCPRAQGPRIGVFAGVGEPRYLDLLRSDPRRAASLGEMQLMIGNGKDHLAPRLSYLLDLRGPSVPIQTACSTSLVAVHVACQSLLHFECDMALAGACSIDVSAAGGYLYQESGILSPDGYCRAFDAAARGTVPGSGAGVVVLKRLDEALTDADPIRAVIKGSAINNDGASKVGYTAPSVAGQRRVIEEACAVAEVEPRQISYIEAHGTGTALGDPIEVEALRQVFGEGERHDSCALGSVKTNIGHCDAAAGIAGLIKSVLCLEHATLVPSLHFERPNPELELERSPFYVPTEATPWRSEPRYAGVSSFGIGGTNAHLVLAQAPEPAPSGAQPSWKILTLSGHTPAAVSAMKADLQDFLSTRPDARLADVAYTLNTGRKAFPVRQAFVCGTRDEASRGLAAEGLSPVELAGDAGPSTVFLFPGQGKAYAGMGRALYHAEGRFRAEVDHLSDRLRRFLGADLVVSLLASDGAERRRLMSPSFWQPALFVVEYALAKLWMSWGIQPAVMIGHSLGEYVAATLAGVLELDDALAMVAARGRGTERLPEGAMLAVSVSEDEIRQHLSEELALAAVNAPELCVVSGPGAAIDRCAEALQRRQPIRLETSYAFHSSMVEPLMEPLQRLASGFELRSPRIPYLSNVSGTWIRDDEATDPGYWAQHIRHTVRFGANLEEATRKAGRVLLEVGPGKVLTDLASRLRPEVPAIATLAPEQSEDRALASALGRLWSSGVSIDWRAYHGGQQRRRVALPTYPFERSSYWVDAEPAPAEPAREDLDTRLPPEDWLYLPSWRQVPPLRAVRLEERFVPGGRWLVFTGASGFGDCCRHRLAALGQDVVEVRRGESWRREGGDRFDLDPADAAGYETLLATLGDEQRLPEGILHTWGVDPETGPTDGFDSLILLAQALARSVPATPLRLAILTAGMHGILDEAAVEPAKAAAIGLVHVLPKEMPHVTCQSLDVDLADGVDLEPMAEAVLAELMAETCTASVAFRHGRRWEPTVDPLDVPGSGETAPFQLAGVYLITNALQEIGLALAQWLTRQPGAAAVLVDRSYFPPRDEWRRWRREQGEDDVVSRRIERLLEIDKRRIRVISADPADATEMRRTKQEVEQDLGPIAGVFHLGRASETGLIQGKDAAVPSGVLRSTLLQATVLDELFDEVDLMVFFASNTAESGGLGQVEQAASHACLNGLAEQWTQRGRRTIAIDWGTWRWTEEGTSGEASFISRQLEEKRRHFGMTQSECLDTLERILGLALPRIVVSTRDYAALMAQQQLFTTDYFHRKLDDGAAAGAATASAEAPGRPDLSSPFEAPRNEVEKLVAETWTASFGLEEIGIHDNFFELGGHSLLALQLLNQLNETFSTRLTLKDFFDVPTIAALAEVISGDSVADEDSAALDELLAEIEGLSGDEVKAALAAQT